MFPILLNLTGKRVSLIGGGAVGLRKLTALLECGAVVHLVDPRPLTLPPEVVHITEHYRAEHLDGAALAFACATPEVNAQVMADCHERGLWVNAASTPTEGDFTLPAVVRRGEFTLAVSTGGASPALARRIREKWEAEFDAGFAEWVRILAEVRTEALATIADESRRRELLDSFADWNWLARLRAEGADAVLIAMREMLKETRLAEAGAVAKFLKLSEVFNSAARQAAPTEDVTPLEQDRIPSRQSWRNRGVPAAKSVA